MNGSDARTGEARARLARLLLAELSPAGCWRGRLASSALATAVAAFALDLLGCEQDRRRVLSGLGWLAAHANPDGGFGDTPQSPSNLSTTLLACAALTRGGEARARERAFAYVRSNAGSLRPEALAGALERAYGRDRTFCAPILACACLAGLLRPRGWELVPQLPLEACLLPHRLFRLLDLEVVSYALPALASVGLVRHQHAPAANPLLRWVRSLALHPCLRRLERMQPGNGGFLEATPLTGFVLMCLCACGRGEQPVARRAATFLRASQREDGSWPIDTDLATWLTTLAVEALAGGETPLLPPQAGGRIRAWLLAQQHTRVHPYTRARPGGWAWSDLPGAVPDADDTSGALLALARLRALAGPADADAATRDEMAQVEAGLAWLLELQNRDGGMPTFCRGWGKLPFDRSACEITAHALRAFAAWREPVSGRLRTRLVRASRRGLEFLLARQRADGSWLPLWFGNQHASGRENPVVGTSRVLRAWPALAALGPATGPATAEARQRAVSFLLGARNPDGGWGGAPGVDSTVEETALAVTALRGLDAPTGRMSEAMQTGRNWLHARMAATPFPAAAPIGLYFASLWYSEKLYPLVFALAALA